MLQTIRNAWRIPELRRKILFTVFVLLVYRFGANIPVPFINADALQEVFKQFETTALGLLNAMSGGALSHATIFALSIQPYINASIIMQLLTIAIPALERLQKDEGEEGRKKIAAVTRYVTVALGLLLGFGYYSMLRANKLVTETDFLHGAIIVLTFTAGSAFIMWLGEQITEFGIGNGISIILFASIVSRGPHMIAMLQSLGLERWWLVGIILAGAILLVAFVVFITNAERRIPVQYAKRVVGRKMYGGQSTFLPIKVNMSGVMPIIFAQSIASFPATIAAFFGVNTHDTTSMWRLFQMNGLIYMAIYLLLIIGFSYFYSTIQFNPIEVANNLKQNGGFIPGFRPGKPTSDFIKKVLNKITFFGAIFLGVIALLPLAMSNINDLSNLSIGGTSLLIVVGVALETVKQLEAQMMMRNYKGFLE